MASAISTGLPNPKAAERKTPERVNLDVPHASRDGVRDHWVRHRCLSGRPHEAVLDVVPGGVRPDGVSGERGGVLAPLGTSQRNRAWEADRLLGLIERLESTSTVQLTVLVHTEPWVFSRSLS
jgi:hypothetical protein